MYAFKVVVTTLIFVFCLILGYVGITDKTGGKGFKVSLVLILLEILSAFAIWGRV